jgi:DUF1680 family protein
VLDTRLRDGEAVRLQIQTEYPWEGTIRITLENTPSKEISLFLRVPGWAERSRVTVNGKPVGENLKSGQYFEIRRSWSSGDKIELVLPMPVQLLEAHPLVEEARNQVAVRRGPIVYCLESVDLPDNIRIADVAISPGIRFQSRFDKELLGGITVLEGKAHVLCSASLRSASQSRLADCSWNNTLYREISAQEAKMVDVRLIPYYAWGNRGDSEMTVWIPLR